MTTEDAKPIVAPAQFGCFDIAGGWFICEGCGQKAFCREPAAIANRDGLTPLLADEVVAEERQVELRREDEEWAKGGSI